MRSALIDARAFAGPTLHEAAGEISRTEPLPISGIVPGPYGPFAIARDRIDQMNPRRPEIRKREAVQLLSQTRAERMRSVPRRPDSAEAGVDPRRDHIGV